MAHLLQIDSSARTTGSISRQLTAQFAGQVTKHEIKVYGPNGLTLTDGGPYVFTFAAGGVVDQVQAPSSLALPNGSYTADLLVAGRQAATTTFTVGQPGSATSGAKM